MNDSNDSDSVPTDLASVVRRGKRTGIGDEFLVTLLRHNGYSASAVYRAFTSHYAADLALPRAIERSDNARDAFIYLLDFLMLSAWAIALGNLLYKVIDRYLPDPEHTWVGGDFDLSFNIATILIAFPIYLWIEARIERGLQRGALLAESGPRRWLTYITLVIAASCVLGDAIWFLTDFLRGELHLPFVLDTVSLIGIAGGIFLYYLAGLRRADRGAEQAR